MLLLHVLFAIAVPLGLEGAILAVKITRVGRVFVIDVPISLFLRGKTLVMIFTSLFWTFEWPSMRLFMLSKIAFPVEDLVAGSITTPHFRHFRPGVFLAPRHRSLRVIIK